MPKIRDEIIKHPVAISYLDLPQDMQREVPANASDPDASTMAMGTLAKTCSALYNFYQPALDKNAATQLLTYVLQGNAAIAKIMFTANPRLLFMESTAEEWASGFVLETDEPTHRSVKMSPLRAIVAAGDRWMLQDALQVLANYVDEKTQRSGTALAAKQIKQQLPNGFKYPPSTYDFTLLTAAFDQDQLLIQTGTPSPATQALIEQFRKDFLPGVVKHGFLFNLNDLFKVLKIHADSYSDWNEYQRELFWCQIVGYLQRLVPAVIAQVICKGIGKNIQGASLLRLLSFHTYVAEKDVTYFPLDTDLAYRLGLAFGIDSYLAAGAWRRCGGLEFPTCLSMFIPHNSYDLKKIYAAAASDRPVIPAAIKNLPS